LSWVFTLTGFFGKYSWMFDLTSHFRLQYLSIQVAAAMLLLLRRRFKLAIPVLLFAWVNIAVIAPYYEPSVLARSDMPQVKLRILQMNVYKHNREYEQAASYIRSVNPDMIALEEYQPHWQKGLEKTGVFRQYPYRLVNIDSENAVYSRFLFQKASIEYISPDRGAVMHVDILLKDRPVKILISHVTVGFGAFLYSWQGMQLNKLAGLANLGDSHVVVIGDLNTTPWGYHFKQFLAKTGLKDTQRGIGLQPSWPAYIRKPWLTFFRIPVVPIDHCLVSPQLAVLSRRIGPYIGSDHYPVVIDLGVPLAAVRRQGDKLRALQ
jgi:endonuclease/exonuclease/phosphatase (EEP) superfamily protein YafD